MANLAEVLKELQHERSRLDEAIRVLADSGTCKADGQRDFWQLQPHSRTAGKNAEASAQPILSSPLGAYVIVAEP